MSSWRIWFCLRVSLRVVPFNVHRCPRPKVPVPGEAMARKTSTAVPKHVMKQSSAKHETRRARTQTKLKLAIKQGLVPKARRPFALYMQKYSARSRLPVKERNRDMARISKQWAGLDQKEKDVFFQASAQEFQLQRDALMRLGIKTRYKAQSQEPVEELVAKPTSSSDIGPYKVHHCPDEAVLGSGTYGTVFAAYSRDGCFVALKIFRSQQHGAQEATQEADCYKQLDKLPLPAREWFPTMLGVDACGWPWPWLALAYAGTSLADHLHAHGKLPQETCRNFALQFQSALHVLHHQAKLLHLDLKPGNILWCQELKRLKVCDFGLSESWEIRDPLLKGPGAEFVVTNPKFYSYVTGMYRPPDLWNLDSKPSLIALQKALTASVDLWSFGCVVFEAACAKHLMKPMNKMHTLSQLTVANWCQNWKNVSSSSFHPRASEPVRYWSARLEAAGCMKPIVLDACHPDPVQRKWIKMN